MRLYEDQTKSSSTSAVPQISSAQNSHSKREANDVDDQTKSKASSATPQITPPHNDHNERQANVDVNAAEDNKPANSKK